MCGSQEESDELLAGRWFGSLDRVRLFLFVSCCPPRTKPETCLSGFSGEAPIGWPLMGRTDAGPAWGFTGGYTSAGPLAVEVEEQGGADVEAAGVMVVEKATVGVVVELGAIEAEAGTLTPLPSAGVIVPNFAHAPDCVAPGAPPTPLVGTGSGGPG
mmetsp:Transcript_45715/g.103025  ORF Transcript_45715/g.103025 Transcript_45715/m.103025 type:complete len:157 (+) Transcript_45715:576-1046(+)